MSVDAQAELQANKRAALEQLRFRKFKKQRTSPTTATFASSSSSLGPNQLPSAAPPPQSRDATVASRFFSAPVPTGTMLVPASSPIQPRPSRGAQESATRNIEDDEAAVPGLGVAKSWGFMRSGGHDPLSTSSGFETRNGVHDASLSSPWGMGSRSPFHMHSVSEHTSPHKTRMDHLHSPDPIDLFNQDSPDSPVVQRVGQRRRAVNSLTTLSNSSEESLPEVGRAFQTTSKPRVMRGYRPHDQEISPATTPQSLGRHLDSVEPSPTSTPQSEAEDPKFTRFKVTMPTHPPALILAAWKQAGGDVKQATVLLSNPNWRPNPVVAAKPSAEVTGRVKELDEATRAMRAAAKEKGKKSMIYANRVLGPTSPSDTPTSKIVIDLTETPSSPVVAPRARKRVGRAVNSDSEPEFIARDRDSDAPGLEHHEDRALAFFNTKDVEAIQEMTGCTPEQATTIIEMRPFDSIDDLKSRFGQGKKKAGPSGISPRMFEDCAAIFEGYNTVDRILEDCEEIGSTIRAAIASWVTNSPAGGTVEEHVNSTFEDGALNLVSASPQKLSKSQDHIESQPALLAADVQLKEYQLLGVNWLHLLYRRRLSCILADEMGLGKTIQVISFFALLKERGNMGPHLIVVPSSTLENWCREFARFAPTISFQTYYAGKEERPQLRHHLLNSQRSANAQGWEVLITTYALAQGDGLDRKFFRSIEWDTCVFDEGHVLKNFQSQRYKALLKFPSRWRLLLTGTPLQNNLHELVSLMNFILPSQFAESLASLWAIFKVKGDAKVTLLAEERVSRAKKMMTPFVLRRRKDQVLKDLPKKTERIEWCEMTSRQNFIYGGAVQRSRKVISETETSEPSSESCGAVNNAKTKALKKAKEQKTKDKKYLENSTNVLMDLRKAALHPMLFRTHFTDQILTRMARELLKEPDFKKREAVFELVKEDMEVMTDSELQNFCASYKSIRKFLQADQCYLDAGKITAVLRLLKEYGKEERKVLIFSQFTQVLDILEAVLTQQGIKYLVLTGSTPVDVRQALVDEFTEDDSISVFLLSTKAGGMGINLTAASVVIMFDQDFNPHNDRQAQDRAYRIGQKREVEVIKLIMRGTIEEDMLKLGETKLALDEAVAGDSEDAEGSAREAEVKRSLMNALRDKLLLEEPPERDVIDGDKAPP